MCVDVSQIHLQYYKKLPRISSVDRQQIKKLQCWEVKKLFTTRFYFTFTRFLNHITQRYLNLMSKNWKGIKYPCFEVFTRAQF